MTISAHRRVSCKAVSALAASVNRKYRHLKPNVLDEIRSMAGLDSSADMHTPEERRPARRRHLITLAARFALLHLYPENP